MKNISNIFRFTLEVSSILLLVISGFKHYTGLLKLVVALILPIAIIVLWSILMAPKSAYRVNEIFRLIIELILFGSIAFLLYYNGEKELFKIYSVWAIVSTFLDHML
ncbi:YrdB family protein [Vagococcus sp. BWB3-3]|uniref:YrdB family protein n=1 Tax=Vagococcus allomyrinae TaxID=2794353 RepID=A0A940SX43_9ENTE|nr:YrdB family protein [Vagococcus allomyrinae]MBP1042866.1 YrdB family protein [Vagococcus allomyrinae]